MSCREPGPSLVVVAHASPCWTYLRCLTAKPMSALATRLHAANMQRMAVDRGMPTAPAAWRVCHMEQTYQQPRGGWQGEAAVSVFQRSQRTTTLTSPPKGGWKRPPKQSDRKLTSQAHASPGNGSCR